MKSEEVGLDKMVTTGLCVNMPLERELAYFSAERQNLLENHRGKFVLIKDEHLIGAFDTPAAAYSKGVSMFGLDPFLVKQVLDQDQVYRNAALGLGLINARI
jgi:hypothetical protein